MADFSRELAAFYGTPPSGTLLQLKGDASTRRYYRFSVTQPSALAPDQPTSLIIMHLPEGAETAAVGRAQAESFLDVQRLLMARGIAVPVVYLSELEQGVMLLEDLSDETFEARLRARGLGQWPELYGAAIDLLAQMHELCAPPGDTTESVVFRRYFEAKLLRWELDHFREYGLEALVGVLHAADRAQLDAHFDALTVAITSLPLGFVHRDYQSRNLMWSAADRLTVIDFQDAMLGPAPYDLVALLCDSYVTLEPSQQHALLERYASRRGHSSAQRATWLRGFRLITVQRKLKDAGRFVFIDRVRGNPDFLPFFTQSLRYVDAALAALPELADLRALLIRLLPNFPEVPPPPETQRPTSEHTH